MIPAVPHVTHSLMTQAHIAAAELLLIAFLCVWQVLCFLIYMANGSYQLPTGREMDHCMGKSTVCGFLEELIAALNHPAVVSRLIRFPSSPEEVRVCIER